MADRLIALPAPAQHATGQHSVADPARPTTLKLRLIVRRSPDGLQAPILTDRTDLSAADIAQRMANRWRQENYFKYAREHFAADALDSCADAPDDPTRLVPNPAKATAPSQVATPRADVAGAHTCLDETIGTAVARSDAPRTGARPPSTHRQSGLGRRKQIWPMPSSPRGTHPPSPAGAGPPWQPVAGDRTETADPRDPDERLQHRKRPDPATAAHYSRGEDDAAPCSRSVHVARRSGDHRRHSARQVRLDPASASRRSQALAAHCAELTDTQANCPGTDRVLAYSVKGHPTT